MTEGETEMKSVSQMRSRREEARTLAGGVRGGHCELRYGERWGDVGGLRVSTVTGSVIGLKNLWTRDRPSPYPARVARCHSTPRHATPCRVLAVPGASGASIN